MSGQWLRDLRETNGHCNGYCNVGAASVCRHATPLKAIKVIVSLPVHVYIFDRISRPSPKEDIMEIVVIGSGVTQFHKAITFDYAALDVVEVNLFD